MDGRGAEQPSDGADGIATPEKLNPAEADAVVELVARATPADGSSPISEHVLMKLRDGTDSGGRHVLLWSGGALVGYSHIESGRGTGAVAEVAIASEAEASRLVDAIVAAAGPDVRIWARGRESLLRQVLDGLDFQPIRVLLQMRRPLTTPIPDPVWPTEVTVRTFVVGTDEPAWLEVNNAAFADHPDQSGWTVDDVNEREAQPWFDPAGFFLAESAGELLGFHWTKIHAAHKPIGEVYVVGVSPKAQGKKLGAALTLQGLSYLRDRGLSTVKLYVEETNEPAVALYERLGFANWNADTCFQRG